MRNQKGITLVEVLAAVVITSIVVIMVTGLLSYTQSSLSKERNTDVSVNIARTIMEELTVKLRNNHETLHIDSLSSEINLAPLHGYDEIGQAFQYDTSGKKYSVVIRSLPFDDSTFPVEGDNDKTFNFTLSDYFRLIQVEVKGDDGRTADLQNYVEIR